MNSDHYQILGVSNKASTREIIWAYRKLALQYHPDRNKSPQANEMMMKINTAYGILSDPRKRAEYDYSIRISKAEIKPDHDHKSKHRKNPQNVISKLNKALRILLSKCTETLKLFIRVIQDR